MKAKFFSSPTLVCVVSFIYLLIMLISTYSVLHIYSNSNPYSLAYFNYILVMLLCGFAYITSNEPLQGYVAVCSIIGIIFSVCCGFTAIWLMVVFFLGSISLMYWESARK